MRNGKFMKRMNTKFLIKFRQRCASANIQQRIQAHTNLGASSAWNRHRRRQLSHAAHNNIFADSTRSMGAYQMRTDTFINGDVRYTIRTGAAGFLCPIQIYPEPKICHFRCALCVCFPLDWVECLIVFLQPPALYVTSAHRLHLLSSHHTHIAHHLHGRRYISVNASLRSQWNRKENSTRYTIIIIIIESEIKTKQVDVAHNSGPIRWCSANVTGICHSKIRHTSNALLQLAKNK